MLNKIYTLKIYDNGWCWKLSSREKTLEDYRKSELWDIALAFILIASLVIHVK